MSRAMGRRWALIAILVLAFSLRLVRLGADSLWYDETVSVTLAAHSVPALVSHTAGDIHPPGYYLLLHAWLRLAGRSDFAVAFLSVLFGVLLVALAYRLGARVFGPPAGLLAALLVAFSPYNLWYSQEVRMYTFAAALGMGALLAIVPGPLSSRRRLLVYVLCAALGLWVLYYFAFLLAAINLVVLVGWLAAFRRGRAGWRWLRQWLLAQGLVLALYSPWLPIAWRQATEPPVPPWRSFTGLGDVLLQTWSALGFGQSVDPARVWPLLAFVVVLFSLGLFGERIAPGTGEAGPGNRDSPIRDQRWLLAGYVFLPVLAIYLASFLTPLFHVRYAFTYSTPFYVLVAAGLVAARRAWRPAFWLGLAVLLAGSAVSIVAYHTDPRYAADDHRAAAEFLAARWRPGDAILVNAGYAYTALLAYWPGEDIAWRGRLTDVAAGAFRATAQRGPVVVQAGTVDGDPGLGWGDADSDFYAMSQSEAEQALGVLFARFNRVWVYRIYDTVTDPGAFLRRWLDGHGRPFEDQVFAGESQLRVQGFLTGRDPLMEGGAVPPVGGTLAGESLQLAAVQLGPPEVAVGQAVDLALVWQVRAPFDARAILFAGLFDAEGRRWAQSDEHPLGPLYLPDAWEAGTVVRTPLRLRVPPGTPPGSYQLEVGWYRFLDGQPRWVPWTVGDRLALGQIRVVPPDDWASVALPAFSHPVGVTIGRGLRLLGFDLPALEGHPGDTLPIVLVWQALSDSLEAGVTVLWLADDAGRVVAETLMASGEAGWEEGQAVRQPARIELPGSLGPGTYNLFVGRRATGGSWLPVRRGPVPAGMSYPLATVRVLDRPVDRTPPAVEYPSGAQFGAIVRFLGYDLLSAPCDPGALAAPCRLKLVLYWQALAPAPVRHKVFLHLIEPGNPAAIQTQADFYPAVPTTGLVPGEYWQDVATVDVPPGLAPGRYALILGLYDESSGGRLPVLDEQGLPKGDSVMILALGE